MSEDKFDPALETATDELEDEAFDRTWGLLRDTAEVHTARDEVAPVVRALVAALDVDPLGEDDTTTRLSAVLDSARARAARAARDRIDADLEKKVRAR
ncbi:hypothetical protein [Antribacter gilvus]|uniref:hypothetical protein n=1 Tax=Antribacter gilvus TaxID=2304675 RepID=UPI0013DF7BE4|nr:hypothetical protein [Antribacter gilvus]